MEQCCPSLLLSFAGQSLSGLWSLWGGVLAPELQSLFCCVCRALRSPCPPLGNSSPLYSLSPTRVRVSLLANNFSKSWFSVQLLCSPNLAHPPLRPSSLRVPRCSTHPPRPFQLLLQTLTCLYRARSGNTELRPFSTSSTDREEAGMQVGTGTEQITPQPGLKGTV